MSEIEFTPAADGRFFIGDKVRVVIEGTLTGFNPDERHYYLWGNCLGANHIDGLHVLHWATDFHVIEPGPRNLGNGAETEEAAWMEGLQ